MIWKRQILILDDDRDVREMLSSALSDDYHIFQAENGTNALTLMDAIHIDLVLVDMIMPGEMSGVEFIEKAQVKFPDTVYIVVSGNQDIQSTIDAFQVGAGNYIQKPVSSIPEFKQKISSALEKRDLIRENRKYKDRLEDLVRQRTSELEEMNRELHESRNRLVGILSRAAEYKDYETGQHFVRVSKYSMFLARIVGLPEQEVQQIQMAAPLHDIGKIGIPESVLLKRDRLTDREFNEMKKHTVFGGEILSSYFRDTLSFSLNFEEDLPLTDQLLECAINIATFHHEKFDGSGYPYRLVGDEIPIEARIVAIADVFDALGSSRPYKEAWPVEECFDFLYEQRGRHFDPALVDAFLELKDEILEVREQFRDGRSHPLREAPLLHS